MQNKAFSTIYNFLKFMKNLDLSCYFSHFFQLYICLILRFFQYFFSNTLLIISLFEKTVNDIGQSFSWRAYFLLSIFDDPFPPFARMKNVKLPYNFLDSLTNLKQSTTINWAKAEPPLCKIVFNTKSRFWNFLKICWSNTFNQISNLSTRKYSF